MATAAVTPSYPNTGPSTPAGTTRPFFSIWADKPTNSQIIMSAALPITTKENPVDDLNNMINQNIRPRNRIKTRRIHRYSRYRRE